MKTLGSIFKNFLLMMDQNRMGIYYHRYGIHPTFRFGEGCYLYGDGEIQIGEGSYMGDRSSIFSDGLVSIGKNVSISHNVRMYTTSRIANQDMHEGVKYHSGRILIDDDVWIGLNVYIGPNVHIGANSVIGANCVVTKDVPPNVIVTQSEQTIISKHY